MSFKVLVCDPNKCTGCKICDIVCSAKKEKAFNPALSRIRTVRIEPDYNLAIACVLCEDPTCVRSCPRNALRKSEESGIIMVDDGKCSGCGWCIQGCEFGAILLHPTEGVVRICDLCDGDPMCVKSCPKEALSLVDTSRESVAQKARRKAIEMLRHV